MGEKKINKDWWKVEMRSSRIPHKIETGKQVKPFSETVKYGIKH